MKARFSVLAALVAALAVVPAVALGSASHAASNSQTYPDSTGEDAQAPDITSVQVSNNDARNLVFKINISNRPALTSDMSIIGFFDADSKASTGDQSANGADYAIELDPGSVGLFQWNGTDYVFAQEQTSLTYSYDTTGATIRINAADLGNTRAFKFAWIAISGITTDANGDSNFDNAHRDYFPDAGHGFASYQVIAKLVLTQTAFSISPSPAKAGKRLTASLAATQSDTSGPVTAGTVKCVAKIGTKGIAGTHSLAAGVASCNWTIPKSAKGKTVHGSISITVQGTTLTKTFTVKVAKK